MDKIWFNEMGIDITADIQYYNKPFITSLIIRIKTRYNRDYEEIGITVFPRSGKISIEHFKKGDLIITESPIKYNGIPNYSSLEKSFDHLEIPEYIKRVLKTVVNNTIIHYNLMDANSTVREILGLNETPYSLTHTVKIQGTIWDKNEYSEDLGKITIDEIMNIDNLAEYRISHNWFIVQLDENGELIAIERNQGKEEYNPFDQEILDGILPTKEDFDTLTRFAETEGEIEFPET